MVRFKRKFKLNNEYSTSTDERYRHITKIISSGSSSKVIDQEIFYFKLIIFNRIFKQNHIHI